MKNLIVVFAFTLSISLQAQNVGIGTNNPQQKLHVAGGVRIDGLAGANGYVRTNVNGDVSLMPFTGNTNQVLLGDGTWGTLNGTVPTGTVVATMNYHDQELIDRGFSLYGFIPGFTQFSTVSATFPANSWAATYYEGVIGKQEPPNIDRNDIFFWMDSVMCLFAENRFHYYNPISDTWRVGAVNPSAFTASTGCKMIYTGTELIVWGGAYTNATNNGFRYNPVTNVFTAIPSTGQPSARTDFGMAYVNNRIVIWGGLNTPGAVTNTGAVLNLATNTWSPMNGVGAPSARMDFSCVVNTVGSNVIVWGGRSANAIIAALNDGALYNPVTNSWTAMSATNSPGGRYDHVSVWSGTEMIVHGGAIGSGQTDRYRNDGGRYNPSTNTWTLTSTVGAPQLEAHAAVWTGSRMLVSGGGSNPFMQQNIPFRPEGVTYDPVANTWQSASVMGVRKGAHKLIMAGTDMAIAFGGVTSLVNAVSGDSPSGLTAHGSRYFLNPVATSRTDIGNLSRLYLYIKQ